MSRPWAKLNCCHVPAFQEHTRQIVTAMADHYGQHPRIIGW